MSNQNTLEAVSKKFKSSSAKIRKYINSIIDEKTFVELDAFASSVSILDDTEALGEGIITGFGAIANQPVYLFAHNQEVLGGSFSKAQADKIIKVVNLALRNRAPIIAIIDSNGARVGEGNAVLEAYSSLVNSITIASIDIPVISIIKGNCVGMMSSIASLSDFVLMSNDSVMSLLPPSVVAAKSKKSEKLSEILGYKALSENSSVATLFYKDENELKVSLNKILAITSGNIIDSKDDPNRISTALNKNISATSIINALSDDKAFLEVNINYAKELKCGYATINGIFCGIAVSDSSISQSLTREGLIKLNNFIEILDKFELPLINIIDSNGIYSDLDNEQNSIALDLAKLMKSISISGNIKIAVIAGNAIGAAYCALASKAIGYDYVLAFENSVITPIDSAVAVNVVYSEEIKKAKDPVKARDEIQKKYSELAGSAINAAKDGFIDNVIKPSDIRPYVSNALLMLLGL